MSSIDVTVKVHTQGDTCHPHLGVMQWVRAAASVEAVDRTQMETTTAAPTETVKMDTDRAGVPTVGARHGLMEGMAEGPHGRETTEMVDTHLQEITAGIGTTVEQITGVVMDPGAITELWTTGIATTDHEMIEDGARREVEMLTRTFPHITEKIGALGMTGGGMMIAMIADGWITTIGDGRAGQEAEALTERGKEIVWIEMYMADDNLGIMWPSHLALNSALSGWAKTLVHNE
jgi:hypothetical protein